MNNVIQNGKDKFNCSNVCKCKSIASIMNTIENDWPVCLSFEEAHCMEGQMSVASSFSLESTKECSIKYPSPVVEKSPPHDPESSRVTIRITIGNKRTVSTEYYIYNTLGLIGTAGGTLGLFVGFSFYDALVILIDFFLEKIQN